MTLPVLPQEVFDEILSQLSDETSMLKSCSLVCRSFRRTAQKILFNSIIVFLVRSSGYEDLPMEPINLVLIVKQAPHLVGYIQELYIYGYHCRLDVNFNYPDLSDALGIFSRKGEFPINLRSLKLEQLRWLRTPHSLRDALVLLMTVHSLRDISFDYVADCPANLVQNLPPLLKSLSLTDTTFSSLPMIRKEPPKLESFTVFFRNVPILGELVKFYTDGIERIVDVTQLKTFQGAVYNPHSMPVFEQILRTTSNSLEHLTLEFDTTDMDFISIDLNQLPHLADITIPYRCYEARSFHLIPFTFIWITKAMKKISYRNVMQNLLFCLILGSQVDMFDFELELKDVWQELDTICSIPQLALSKTFCGITFHIKSSAPKYDAFSDLIRNRLPETKGAGKLHIKASIY